MSTFRQTYLLIATILLIAVFSLASAQQVRAGELTQNFVNPDFGGNPNNGGYLLSNATAQNSNTAPVKASTATGSASSAAASKTDTAQQFSEQVNRLVMSALAGRLVNKAFGADAGTSADNTSIDTGISTISVATTGSGTSVTIVDNATGGKSIISIPNY
jgi:curli production assembly/transport component CsgF